MRMGNALKVEKVASSSAVIVLWRRAAAGSFLRYTHEAA